MGITQWYYGGEIPYLIGTGKYWKGTIGSGKVVFRYNNIGSVLFTRGLDTYDKNKEHIIILKCQ